MDFSYKGRREAEGGSNFSINFILKALQPLGSVSHSICLLVPTSGANAHQAGTRTARAPSVATDSKKDTKKQTNYESVLSKSQVALALAQINP